VSLRLIQMHGAPGSGKSTLAAALGRELGAVVIDKDLIATALIRDGIAFSEAGPHSYAIAWMLLPSLLGQGFSVIHDSPCFWPQIEQNGRAIAARADANYHIIECICADEAELDRRLATRARLESNPATRLEGPMRPGMYTLDCARLVLDTTQPVADLVAQAVEYLIGGAPGRTPSAPASRLSATAGARE